MARQASSKPADSTANLGFGMVNGGHSSGARKSDKGRPQVERGGVHQFYTPFCFVRLLVEMLTPVKGRILPKLIVESSDAQVTPLIKQQYANETQSRALATLRDTLLPKLLS